LNYIKNFDPIRSKYFSQATKCEFFDLIKKMGYIGKNWRGVKNSINLSQKFLNKVKPEAALKNKIEGAGKKMEEQILRLEQAHNKLKQNHERIFKKIVEAKLTRNESMARTYATELSEIRKVRDRIGNAKLSMEQIKKIKHCFRIGRYCCYVKSMHVINQRTCSINIHINATNAFIDGKFNEHTW